LATNDERHYGRCPCSGSYDQRWVEVRMKIADTTVVLSDIPQGACPLCGSRVYKAGLLDAIEALMRSPAAPSS
jgi:hypothetical protein